MVLPFSNTLPARPVVSEVTVSGQKAIAPRPPRPLSNIINQATTHADIRVHLKSLPCQICEPGKPCSGRHNAWNVWKPIFTEPKRPMSARQKAINAQLQGDVDMDGDDSDDDDQPADGGDRVDQNTNDAAAPSGDAAIIDLSQEELDDHEAAEIEAELLASGEGTEEDEADDHDEADRSGEPEQNSEEDEEARDRAESDYYTHLYGGDTSATHASADQDEDELAHGGCGEDVPMQGDEEGSSGPQPRNDDAAENADDSTQTGRARKKRKLGESFFNHRKPIFPPPSAYKGKSLTEMPAEVMVLIFRNLTPPDLVKMSRTCHTLYLTLQNGSLDQSVWGYSRIRYENMPGPHPYMKGKYGRFLTERSWAFMWFAGGFCELCGDFSPVPPVAFGTSRVIRICPQEECRRHWRQQIASSPRPVNPVTEKQKRPKVLEAREPDTPPAVSGGVELGLPGANPPRPNPDLKTYKIDSKIKTNRTLWSYIFHNLQILQGLAERYPHEQWPWLHAVLKAAVKDYQGAGLGLQGPPPKKILNIVEDHMNANKYRRWRKISPFQDFLIEWKAIDWPDDQIKTLCEKGLVWVEVPSFVRAMLATGTEDVWERGRNVPYRHYRISDVNEAIAEWVQSGTDGTRPLVIQKWRNAEMLLKGTIAYNVRLSQYREKGKSWKGYVRVTNDKMYREHVRKLDAERQNAWTAEVRNAGGNPTRPRPTPMNWEDACNSPTLRRMRGEVEAYGALAINYIWQRYEPQIIEETIKLRERRHRRQIETKIRERRNVAYRFWLYLARDKRGPELAGLPGPRVMPAFRIFNTFPVVQQLPDKQNDAKNWNRWLVHAYHELKRWESDLRELMRVKAQGHAPEGIDRLWRCEACDKAAAKHYEERMKSSRDQGSKRMTLTNAVPAFKPPRTYKEIVEHECVERWSVDNICLDVSASALAKHACEVLNLSPTETTEEQVKKYGRVWRCTTCDVWLNWGELYPHQMRHGLHPNPLRQVTDPAVPSPSVSTVTTRPADPLLSLVVPAQPGRDVRVPLAETWTIREAKRKFEVLTYADLPGPEGAVPVPANFCKKMKMASDEERRKTRVMCAPCVASARRLVAMAEQGEIIGGGRTVMRGGRLKEVKKIPQIMHYDGLRDHMQQKHGWADIHTEDIHLISSGLGMGSGPKPVVVRKEGNGIRKITGGGVPWA